jgi:hypothetical protein
MPAFTPTNPASPRVGEFARLPESKAKRGGNSIGKPGTRNDSDWIDPEQRGVLARKFPAAARFVLTRRRREPDSNSRPPSEPTVPPGGMNRV